jgi:copper(I)-binding protein
MRRFLILITMLLLPLHGFAAVTATGVWVRAALPGQDNLAAYLTLTSDRDDTLVGVEADGFSMAMLHETSVKNGISSMEDVDSIALPAHQVEAFAPGGRHIMLMDFAAAPKPGGHVMLTLHFEHAQVMRVAAVVKPATARGP